MTPGAVPSSADQSDTAPHTLRSVSFKLAQPLDEEFVHILCGAFDDLALSTSAMRENRKHNGTWILEWLFETAPSTDNLIARLSLQSAVFNMDFISPKAEDFSFADVATNQNWLEKTYKAFPPFSVGPFFIYGSHYDGEVSAQQIPLKIDAATAFGSGEHETTKGCLEAMLDLKSRGICPWNTLDMGTGSGILAIAAWKLWKSPILAVDNDAESVRVTQVHAQMNGVNLAKSCLSTGCGDGFKTPEVAQQKPYELILMNILAGPVIEMAPAAIRVLDDNGYIVLSGMLVEQADLVTSAYEGEGLTFKRRYDIGEWSTLVLHKDRSKN